MKNNTLTSLQIEMMQTLLNSQSINVQELQKRSGIPERTIRDKLNKVIKPLFPDSIYNEKGIGWASKDNLNEKTILKADELVALQTLKNYAEGLDKELSTPALNLLSKFERGMFTHEVIHRTKKEKLEAEDESTMTILMNAIAQKKKVSCLYSSKQRVIEPLMIVMLEGYWYVHLFDIDQKIKVKKAKNFHLKSMESVSLLDDVFEYPNMHFIKKLETSINAFFDSEGDYIVVELLVHRSIIKYFERIPLSPKQKIYGNDKDEYLSLNIEVTNLNEIVPTIQQYLPNIKVIHPAELEVIIKENISNYNPSS